MSSQAKTRGIEELTRKLSALKEQKSVLDDEAYGWAEKRDRLNEQVKSLRGEILGLRSERDRVNEKVKELKRQRNETTTKIHERIKEIKTLTQESNVLAKRKPSRSHQALQREIEGIDWKIQTSSLTLQEEKELVEKVKQLETQLSVHRKLEQSTQKIAKLRTEVKALKAENERRHEELTKNAKQSQEIHQNMLEKIEESRKLKMEADTSHKRFLEVREETRPLRDEITQTANQIRRLREESRKEEEKEKKQSQDALRETLEKQAREKLKRGEKLSWEEFQLLAEKGITA